MLISQVSHDASATFERRIVSGYAPLRPGKPTASRYLTWRASGDLSERLFFRPPSKPWSERIFERPLRFGLRRPT